MSLHLNSIQQVRACFAVTEGRLHPRAMDVAMTREAWLEPITSTFGPGNASRPFADLQDLLGADPSNDILNTPALFLWLVRERVERLESFRDHYPFCGGVIEQIGKYNALVQQFNGLLVMDEGGVHSDRSNIEPCYARFLAVKAWLQTAGQVWAAFHANPNVAATSSPIAWQISMRPLNAPGGDFSKLADSLAVLNKDGAVALGASCQSERERISTR